MDKVERLGMTNGSLLAFKVYHDNTHEVIQDLGKVLATSVVHWCYECKVMSGYIDSNNKL